LELKSKKLCRIIFEFAPKGGGSVTHTIELSRHMAPYLNKQFIVTPESNEDTTELDKSFSFEVHRVSICRFEWLVILKNRFLPALPVNPLIHLSFGISAMMRVIKLNNKYGIDIIQAHGAGVGPTATICNWLLRKPSVWMMHGTCMAYSRLSGYYETFLTKLFKPRRLLVLDDGSPAPRKFKQLLGRRVTVVHHAIDTEYYKPLPKPEILNNKLCCPEKGYVVLSPHSLIPVKGQEYAIKAFDELMKKTDDDRSMLIIAGSGPLERQLKSYARKLGLAGHVKFIGRIPAPTMPRYYALSDTVLATSLYSNKNRTVQEAMACAKPVVAFDAGGTGKVVVNGQTGLLAEPGNSLSLARQIEKLYKNRNYRLHLGSQAREFIKQNLNWDKRIEKELDVYSKLIWG
jgi:glycosyltransferase involved in cell wall biosynthesis